MDVQLYIYDLSNGLARQMSLALLGTQIDAVYHTSIVMEGLEYVYDGGIKIIKPGQNSWTPLQILNMGTTELPMDVIQEYLESLKEVYTMEVNHLNPSGLHPNADSSRHMIFGLTTATTSLMISLFSYSVKEYQTTSQTFHKLFSILPLAECWHLRSTI